MWIAGLTATFPHTHSPSKSQTFFDFGFNVKTDRSDSNLDWNLLRDRVPGNPSTTRRRRASSSRRRPRSARVARIAQFPVRGEACHQQSAWLSMLPSAMAAAVLRRPPMLVSQVPASTAVTARLSAALERMMNFSSSTIRKKTAPPAIRTGHTCSGMASLPKTACSGGA